MTTKQAHTPGPWTSDGHSIGVALGTICHMYRPGDASGRGLTQSEQEANADLVAAAPDLLRQRNDLLAACEGLLAQQLGPVMVHGDGRGRDGRKTGLSGEEFDALRESRIVAARAAIAAAKAAGPQAIPPYFGSKHGSQRTPDETAPESLLPLDVGCDLRLHRDIGVLVTPEMIANGVTFLSGSETVTFRGTADEIVAKLRASGYNAKEACR